MHVHPGAVLMEVLSILRTARLVGSRTIIDVA